MSEVSWIELRLQNEEKIKILRPLVRRMKPVYFIEENPEEYQRQAELLKKCSTCLERKKFLELVQPADEGDIEAGRDLLVIIAGYIRNNSALPTEIASWFSARLFAVAEISPDKPKKIVQELRLGKKRGGQPSSREEKRLQTAIAWAVFTSIDNQGMTEEKNAKKPYVFDEVAEWANREFGTNITGSAVKSYYDARRPEIALARERLRCLRAEESPLNE